MYVRKEVRNQARKYARKVAWNRNRVSRREFEKYYAESTQENNGNQVAFNSGKPYTKQLAKNFAGKHANKVSMKQTRHYA